MAPGRVVAELTDVDFKRKPRWRIRWWGWLLGLAFAFVGMATVALLKLHRMVDSWQPPPLEVAFAGRPLPTLHTLEQPEGRSVQYGATGREDGPLVMLVHGTPGSWGDFFQLMQRPELTEHARVISLDRPGWGGSARDGLETSMEVQAAAVAAVARAHPENRPAVLVGHSLGAAVVARVAMDAPELVDGLVLVAGSIDPALEETTWYQAIARLLVIKWAIPQPLTRSNDELAPFKQELEAMLPLWDAVRCPVIVVQGELDDLVPPANADFAARVLTAAPTTIQRVPDVGHLIPWQRPELISGAALELLQQLRDEK